MLNWFPALLLLLLQTTACPDWSGGYTTSAMTRIQCASIVAAVTEDRDAKASPPAPTKLVSEIVKRQSVNTKAHAAPIRVPAAPTLCGAPCRAGPSVA